MMRDCNETMRPLTCAKLMTVRLVPVFQACLRGRVPAPRLVLPAELQASNKGGSSYSSPVTTPLAVGERG